MAPSEGLYVQGDIRTVTVNRAEELDVMPMSTTDEFLSMFVDYDGTLITTNERGTPVAMARLSDVPTDAHIKALIQEALTDAGIGK